MTKNSLVYKSNELINARYSAMSLNEQLLVLSAIASVDPRTLTGVEPVEISVSSFADLADKNHSEIYGDIKKAAKRLLRRVVRVENPEQGVKAVETTWISAIEYLDGEAAIKMYFAPKILPYLSQLSGNFTKYKLEHVAHFKSKYGIRMYELLMQWQCVGEREITIEEFRDKFELGEKYKAIKDLKLKVLQPALDDINKHSNMNVKVGQRKRGKRVAAFQFDFKLKAETRKTRAKHSKSDIEKAARPGETYAEVEARLIRDHKK